MKSRKWELFLAADNKQDLEKKSNVNDDDEFEQASSQQVLDFLIER